MRLSRPVALLLAVALAGCGGGGGGGSSSSTSRAVAPVTSAPAAPVATSSTPTPVAPSIPPHVGTWLKGDLHVHSTHSGDASWGDDVTGVAACAQLAGLDFIAISDHRNSDCLTDPKFTGAQTPLVLLAGEEWGQPGHSGAIGLTRPVVSDSQDETQGAAVAVQKIQQAVDDVHSMGGVWVLNHPIDTRIPWLWPVNGFDALEAWNQSWALGSPGEMSASDVQAWASAHGMNQTGAPQTPPEADAAVSVHGGGQNLQRLALYDAHLLAGHHIAAVGGGDTHYVFLPGSPTTVVFAAAHTRDAILDGIRHGRTLVQRAPDAPALEFTADLDNKGTFDGMIGDALPLGHVVTFKLHVKDDLNGKLQLVRNGAVVQEWPVTSDDFTVTFQDAPTAVSYYRVNVLEPLDTTLPNVDLLRDLILGTASSPVLQAIAASSVFGTFGSKLQTILNSGVPALYWVAVYGHQVGVSIAPVATQYPRLVIPKAVSQWFNMAIHDPGYAMGVVTSPIWVQ